MTKRFGLLSRLFLLRKLAREYPWYSVFFLAGIIALIDVAIGILGSKIVIFAWSKDFTFQDWSVITAYAQSSFKHILTLNNAIGVAYMLSIAAGIRAGLTSLTSAGIEWLAKHREDDLHDKWSLWWCLEHFVNKWLDWQSRAVMVITGVMVWHVLDPSVVDTIAFTDRVFESYWGSILNGWHVVGIPAALALVDFLLDGWTGDDPLREDVAKRKTIIKQRAAARSAASAVTN